MFFVFINVFIQNWSIESEKKKNNKYIYNNIFINQ